MHTITVDGNKLEIGDTEFKAIKELFHKETQDIDILWKPEQQERYWYIDQYGDVEHEVWTSTDDDENNFAMGNMHKTKEQAEQALSTGWIAKRKAEVKILRFIAEMGLGFEPNWEDGEQDKFHIAYDFYSNTFDIYVKQTISIQHLMYFRSEKDAQKVIDNCEKELKLLFGIK